jgi:C1A family cysteine protease
MGNYWSNVEHVEVEEKVNRTYGWKKDRSRDGDLHHMFSIQPNQDLVSRVDLRKMCPPVYDQGHLGSCTANAIAAAYEFDEMKEAETNVFAPSRLFIYYNEREIEGHVDEDSGAEIKDGIQSISVKGVCPEAQWPYDIAKYTEKPNDDCYKVALNHKSIEHKRVYQNLGQLKQCLLEGFPFVFGFIVYESFESEEVKKSGIVPMPKEGEKILGGHAVVCVGFDDEKKQFIVRNSWSEQWGDQGYCWMPYDYLTNADLASDMWTVRKVKDCDIPTEPKKTQPTLVTTENENTNENKRRRNRRRRRN